jgi:uncharacterized Fe-S cluster protein YjdI
MSEELRNSTFFLVGSVPESFRSANLRNYFSQLVEKNSFACFHYKHRPEHYRHKVGDTTLVPEGEGSRHGTVTSKCCVVAVRKRFQSDFLKTYHNKNWTGHDGDLLAGKVRITNLKIAPDILPDQAAKDEAGKKE